MGYDCNNLTRFVRHDCFGRFDERAACVGHVVDEDGDLVFYVADEHHAGDFIGACALFVDESEAEIEAVGYGCCSEYTYQPSFFSYGFERLWEVDGKKSKGRKQEIHTS
jgi:hypothetical protein